MKITDPITLGHRAHLIAHELPGASPYCSDVCIDLTKNIAEKITACVEEERETNLQIIQEEYNSSFELYNQWKNDETGYGKQRASSYWGKVVAAGNIRRAILYNAKKVLDDVVEKE